MYLYNSYCYPDLDSAAQSLYSAANFNLGILQSYTPINTDTVRFNYFDGVQNLAVEYKFMACTHLGFNNSYFGITPDELTMLTGKMILLFVIAYGIKQAVKLFN